MGVSNLLCSMQPPEPARPIGRTGSLPANASFWARIDLGIIKEDRILAPNEAGMWVGWGQSQKEYGERTKRRNMPRKAGTRREG